MPDINLENLSPAQRDVWQAEQDYWVLTRNKDVEGFLALAHDRVAVWPATATSPIDRARLRDTQRTRGDREALTGYELTFHSVQVYGDAAVVYSTVVPTGNPSGGAPVKSRSLITHTWVKDGGKWRLAGGMSRRA
jgi:ketosteroid isomerase-like protein